MAKFTTAAAAPQSDARRRLASMIEERNAIAAKIDGIQSALERLATAQTSEGQVVSELQALESVEAVAMGVWARSGEGDAPQTDVERRERLTRKLVDVRAKAAAARGAEPALAAERDREIAKLPGLGAVIDEVVANVLLEEVEPLLADFEEANHALGVKAARIGFVEDMIGGMARSTPDANQARPLFVMLETLTKRLQKIFPRAVPDVDAASKYRVEWGSLVGRLHADASATLGE